MTEGRFWSQTLWLLTWLYHLLDAWPWEVTKGNLCPVSQFSHIWKENNKRAYVFIEVIVKIKCTYTCKTLRIAPDEPCIQPHVHQIWGPNTQTPFVSMCLFGWWIIRLWWNNTQRTKWLCVKHPEDTQ